MFTFVDIDLLTSRRKPPANDRSCKEMTEGEAVTVPSHVSGSCRCQTGH